MKRIVSKISIWSLSLMTLAAFNACSDSDVDDSGNGYQSSVDGITISNVVPTYNDVTFDVTAENSIAIAYIAVKSDAVALTVQDVFDQGVSDGNTSGTFTYKGTGLESETDYILYVVARSTSGNLGPAQYKFTTAVNTGAASSDEAAGIRVESIGTGSLVWEVSNGSAVDFSITMVQPTILMENECMEAAKNGVSEEDYICSYLTSDDYAYLVRVNEGASTITSYNYSEIYTSYPMLPDSRYTIYTVGCSGDYDDGIYTTLAFTKLDVKTEAFTRIGNPYVSVELKSQDYIGLRHYLTPNDDAKYWTKFFTNTSEIEEFRAYYDALEGEGQGEYRLREFLAQTDPYVLDQSGETEIYMDLDWAYAGIDFSRLALGFDENLMPGDEYGESIARLLEVDQNSEDGGYTILVDSVGAGNFHVHTRLMENCFRVYWTVVDAGTYDDNYFIDNPDIAAVYAQTLDAEGYVHFRNAEDGTEDTATNANMDVIHDYYDFWYGYETEHAYQVISVSLNYSGKLSTPVISPVFTTLERTLGDFDPAITVTTDEDGVSKTSILIKYAVHDDAYELDHRLFYHRFVNASDELFLTYTTDDEIRNWMLEDNGYNSNLWTTISTDYEHEDKYNYHFNWAGMEAGTTYKYLYFTERGDGQVSKLATTEFTTLSNDGGDNPTLTVSIDPDSFYDTENDLYYNYETFYAEGSVAINSDVVTYNALWVEEYVVESYYWDPNDDTQLGKALYYCVSQQGLPYVDTSVVSTGYLKKGERAWLVAQGQGANGVESLLSYIEVDADWNVLSQVDVDITDYVGLWGAPALSQPTLDVTFRFSAAQNIMNGYSRPALNSAVTVQKSAAAKTAKDRISESDAASLRQNGVPFYTLSELSRKAILKEELK